MWLSQVKEMNAIKVVIKVLVPQISGDFLKR
jgi:hypothetical protein